MVETRGLPHMAQKPPRSLDIHGTVMIEKATSLFGRERSASDRYLPKSFLLAGIHRRLAEMRQGLEQTILMVGMRESVPRPQKLRKKVENKRWDRPAEL
jgi:hypothetical protein